MILCFSINSAGIAQSYEQRIAQARTSDYKTEQQIENLLEISEELNHTNYLDTLGFVEYFIAMRFRKLSNNKKLIEHATNAIDAFKQSDYEGYRFSFSYLIRAYANKNLGEQDNAIRDALFIESLRLDGRGYEALGDAIKLQAETFRNNGDFESSINKLNKFLLTERVDSLNNYFKSNVYLELSMAYSNYDDSISLQKAIKAIDSVYVLVPDIDNQYLYKDKTNVLALLQLGHIHYKFKDWNQTIYFYEQALEEAMKMPLDLDVNTVRLASMANLLELYGNLGKHEKIKLLIAKQEDVDLTIDPIGSSTYFENLSSYYRSIGSLEKAGKSINLAKEILDHPKESVQSQKYKQKLAQILKEDLEIDYKKYLIENNQSYLSSASQTMLTLDTLVDLIGLELLFETSVFEWREKAKAIYDIGLRIAFAQNDVDLVWRCAEKTKSLALLETIINTQQQKRNPSYEKVGNELAELRKKETRISQQLQTAERLADKIQLEEERTKIKDAQLQLYLTEQEKLRKIIPEVVGISEIQKLVGEKTLILYSNDSKDLYGIALNSETVEMKKLIDVETLSAEIDRVNQYLKRETQVVPAQLVSYVLTPFTQLDTSLAIIPDEYLAPVSFASLVTNGNKYLIEEHTISYDVSATFYKEHISHKPIQVSNSVVVIPDYEGNLAQQLRYASDEGDRISEVINVTQLNGEHALKVNVEKELQQNELLHFSGHLESINDEAQIMLSSNQTVTAADIYTLDSSVKFVFMNACESASGKILVGEGIANFARSFMQSGAQTILQTLWNVNDKSSATIGTTFYQEIGKGKDVDEALRLAQLNYISTVDDFNKHPYYWAGIIAIGKTEAVHFKSESHPIIKFGSITLLLFCLILLYKRFS